MIRLTLAALLFAACGDVPFVADSGPDWCDADADLAAIRALPHSWPQSCPVGMPLEFEGTGCVRCEFTDTCGGRWQVDGCSPAEGVWCHYAGHVCPATMEVM